MLLNLLARTKNEAGPAAETQRLKTTGASARTVAHHVLSPTTYPAHTPRDRRSWPNERTCTTRVGQYGYIYDITQQDSADGISTIPTMPRTTDRP